MSAVQISDTHVGASLCIDDFVRRVAREMRIAAAVADDCQDALGDANQLEIPLAVAMRFQGLDLLSQQLIELGKLLDRVASTGVSAELSPALLDDIALSDLRRRLAGQADGIRVADPDLW